MKSSEQREEVKEKVLGDAGSRREVLEGGERRGRVLVGKKGDVRSVWGRKEEEEQF